MTGFQIGLLVLIAIAFAFWTVIVFRILFRLRARAAAETGRPFPGLRATLRSFGGFLVDPGMIGDRRQLGWATLSLFIAILAFGTLGRG